VCLGDAEVTAALARFKYDARNRRVARQRDNQWTYMVFDPAGNPLSEFALTGSPTTPWAKVRDYVWLDGRFLAQVEYSGAGGAEHVYYAHLDHLGQPRALTNAAGQLVWATYQRPYGEVLEKTVMDPLSGKTVVTNLRLPGQYDERLLAGLGLQGPYYNWYRWYLPSVGRYMELDPWTLAGGFSNPFGVDWYGYANQNPMRWIDPIGLWPGQFPPPPPGYDPSTWSANQWPNGKWYLTDPSNNKYTAHTEGNEWRHWDIRDKDNNDGGSWPKYKKKAPPNQKRPLKSDQCPADPSGDAPGWSPPGTQSQVCLEEYCSGNPFGFPIAQPIFEFPLGPLPAWGPALTPVLVP
jgi:RHS repeat-associated protein